MKLAFAVDIPKIGLAFTTALVAYMKPEKISMLTRYFKPEMLFKTGVLSQDWIQEIIAQTLNPLKLLASAAIPGFFDAVKLNGHHYYDGGSGIICQYSLCMIEDIAESLLSI